MTDEELLEWLKLAGPKASLAADRIEALIAENERLGKQCEGLMQAGMNNGQALILAEAKLAKALEAIAVATQHEPKGLYPDHVPNYWLLRSILAELKGESHE